MKEKFKTFLLISLVGISLMFTKSLWIELPKETFNIFNKNNEIYKTSYLLSDMIVPNKYLLNFNDKKHTFFYDDSKYKLWKNSRRILGSILKSKNMDIIELSKEDLVLHHDKRSISFYFPTDINTYILAKSLEVREPNIIIDKIENIKNIYIYLGKGEPFFIFSDGNKYIGIHDNSIDISQLTKQVDIVEAEGDYNHYRSIREALNIDNDVYISHNMKSNLPKVYVENEIRNLDEEDKRNLAQRFFNDDIDLIEEIVGNNGSNIYLYDQRLLKLNINGTLEYFHPLEEPVRKRNLYQSLITAADFISKYAGVPKGMYLAKVEDIEMDGNYGYNLTFRYRVRGIPIILGNEIVDFVEMEVFNDHIRSYKHYIRKDMNKPVENNLPSGDEMLSSFYILDKNKEFIVQKYIEENNINLLEGQIEPNIEEILSSAFIQDITLSYFDPCIKDTEDELIGVWVVKTNKGLYAFDIYNGSLVYEKN